MPVVKKSRQIKLATRLMGHAVGAIGTLFEMIYGKKMPKLVKFLYE